MGRETYTRGDSSTAEVFGPITATHAAVAVAATEGGTSILAASNTRKYAFVQNVSDTDVYITIEGTTPTTSIGICLKAAGGYYEMGPAWGNVTFAAIKGIHGDSGTKTVLVTSG